MPEYSRSDDHGTALRTLDVLVQEHGRLRALLDNIPDIVFFKDNKGHYLDCNAAFTDLLGLSRYEVLGKTSDDISFGVSAEAVQQDQQVIDTESPLRVRKTTTNHLGQQILLDLIKAPVFDGIGAMLGIVGIGRDITRQREMEDDLQLAASVFQHAHDGILITDHSKKILNVNAAFEHLTGYSREEVIGQSPGILRSNRHDDLFYKAMWQSIQDQGYWKGELWNRRKSGDIYLQNETIIALRNAEGVITHYLGMFSDITELKASEERLRYMAHHDTLTHLPNRALLADRISQALAQATRRKTQLAVCYIDLDGFKPINDNFGHAIGDRLLVEIAGRLTESLRAGDTVARLGGDEFAILLNDLDNGEMAGVLLNRILSVIAAPVNIAALEPLQVSASIGYTIYPTDGSDADTLLRHADLAMYQAKVAGRNRIHQFDALQDKLEQTFIESQARVMQGLENQEFVLYFQPLVDMRKGTVVGAETLIRWQHPERGLVAPGEFLPLVENSEVIVHIGRWVLGTALDYLEQWNQQGLKLQISVNIAARHIMQPTFVSELKSLLAQHPSILPEQLELEILETAALEDMGHVSVLIDECRALGVRFALDDFGTGYSSLTYFKRLNADTLKIDQSFVRDILDDPEDLAIVEGILGLTGAFQRHAIAEGVETIEHGILLLHLGCNYAQGYGIARPMPAQLLAEWVKNFVPDPCWITSTTLHWHRENFPLMAVEVDHRRWVQDIERAVQGKIPVATLLAPSDARACRFGHWYHNSGSKQFGHLPEFNDIERLHVELHLLGGDICHLVDSGNQKQAESLIPALLESSERLIEGLRTLQVIASMNSN